MKPNEVPQGCTGEAVLVAGRYKTACCALISRFTEGALFPRCPQHGDAVWTCIPLLVQNEFGTNALMEQWREELEGRHFVAASDHIRQMDSVDIQVTRGIPSEETFGTPEIIPSLEVVLQAAIIVPGHKTTEGHIVKCVGPGWVAVLRELERDPTVLFRFRDYPRQFEELLAAAYEQDGWDVVLTPYSRDGGRDVIASKGGFCSVKILDQAKAYAPGHRVTAKDVQAMIGVVTTDASVSKGVVTTTSQFAPGIAKNPGIARLMPDRLELRDGKKLLEHLAAFYKGRL